jgi:hypothetical protein
MAVEVWKGYSKEDVAVTDAGIEIIIPNGDRAFVCSVDNAGASNLRAVLNTAFADKTTDQGVTIRGDKAYTFVSMTQNQRIYSVTLFCKSGETTTANVSFS